MMLDKLINIPLIRGKSVAGVYLTIHQEGTFVYDLVILRMKKDKLEIIKSVKSISLLEEISEIINSSMPIILTINGKGILHKKIQTENGGNSLLSKILPNASPKDFYIQQVGISDDESFLSVIRKELLERIMGVFKSDNLYVTDIILGPFVLNSIQPIIEQTNEQDFVPGYKLLKEGDKIIDFIKETNDLKSITYKIGGDSVSADEIIPLATGFSFFYSFERLLEVDRGIDTSEKNEFFYKRVFSYLGWGILIFFFTLLIINYLFFAHYNDRRNILALQVNQNEGLLTKLSQLSKEVEQKEQFLQENGYLEPSRFSYFADRLAFILPGKISLTAINAYPLEKEVKQGKEMECKKKQIIISGTTPDSDMLSSFMQKVKNEKWVSEVNMINYLQENFSSQGEFDIEIIIK